MTKTKRICVVVAAGLTAITFPAMGVVTGHFEYRFVATNGLLSTPNQGLVGLSNGQVLGLGTQVTPTGGLIRQRFELQARAVNIAGTAVATRFNADFTALLPATSFPAQDLGVFAAGGNITFGDGAIASPSFNATLFSGFIQVGSISGATWNNLGMRADYFTPALPWPYQSSTPAEPTPLDAGAGGIWVRVAQFAWTSPDVTARTVNGTFIGDPGLTRAFVGHGVISADFPSPGDELDGWVTYIRVFSGHLQSTSHNFSLALQENLAPSVSAAPKKFIADPLVNPDAANLVLASFADPEGQAVTVSITDDGGIGSLGGLLSVDDNNSATPSIVLTWDAPNAAIGQTFTVLFEYADAMNGPLSGSVLVTVVPAPSALALLGLGGLVASRRRRD